MRHNLDISSVDAVVNELNSRLGCKVGGSIPPIDVEILEDLKLSYHKYDDTSSANIYVEDEYLIARLLIAKYGDGARNRIANCPDYQHIINDIDDVNRGLYSYGVNSDTFMDFGMTDIWRITNDTISGMPGLGSDRWSWFCNALDHNSRSNNEYLLSLIKSRKQFYKFIKPILVDEYVYFHPDQGKEEELAWMSYFDDIPKFLDKIDCEIFDLSEHILNLNSEQIFNSDEVSYVIRDDFKDLL